MDPDPVNRRLVGGGVSQNKLHFFHFFTIYMFGCLRGTLVVSKVLRTGFFVSSETVGYPDGSVRKFKRKEKPYFHQSDSGGRFVFTPKCLGDRNRNILKHNRSEKWWVSQQKSPEILVEENSYPEICSLSRALALEFSRQYLLLRTVGFQKKNSHWVPLNSLGRQWK